MEKQEINKELKQITFFLPSNIKEEIRKKAKDDGLNLASYCRFVIIKNLNQKVSA